MALLPRLLVVDDDELVGNSLRRLYRHRFEVTVVQSVEHALGILPEADVVLCDLKMPSRGGMEFYANVRRDRPEMLGRIVFMTGDLCCMDTEEFLAGVPNPHFEKPFDPDRVGDTLFEVAAA